ncbi:MAG: hypothetical protein ACK551_00350 [Vampirovibrionales bacterium]
MIPTTIRYSPFQQTPALQTAPAAQRSVAQRSGYTPEIFEAAERRVEKLQEELKRINDLPELKKQALKVELNPLIVSFQEIAHHLTRLRFARPEDVGSTFSQEVRAAILKDVRPEFLESFNAFMSEGDFRVESLELQISNARSLSDRFFELYKKVSRLPVSSAQ